MKILGIETSCDETAAAVVRDGHQILSNVIASQQQLHQRYGGVVPEVACRAHVEAIAPVIEDALGQAGAGWSDIDAVAVTSTPGLIGALLIGVAAAKTLAWRLDIPLVAVNHLEAHVYANVLDGHQLTFPAIALVVSGGHTLLLRCDSITRCHWIGSTNDDAAGEAFDKVAAILGLGYPGGPVIDKIAAKGNPSAIRFPRTYLEPGSLDFSFSGIKTAVLYHVKGQNASPRTPHEPMSDMAKADIAASFQEAVVEVLVEKTFMAARCLSCVSVILGGGVACNSRLRAALKQRSIKEGIPVFWPAPNLCTDNAAMIAGLAFHLLQEGRVADLSLDAVPTLVRAPVARK